MPLDSVSCDTKLSAVDYAAFYEQWKNIIFFIPSVKAILLK